MDALLGDTLVKKDGTKVAVADVVAKSEVVGLYFSAHWCGPCRQFTPMLSTAYGKALHGKGMEIVFVSSDKDDGAFKEYFGSMPWLALPFEDRARKNKLSSTFKVQGIPTLVLLDAKTGEVITKDGRMSVAKDPTGEQFPWKPAPVTDILSKMQIVRNGAGAGEKASYADAVKADVVGLYVSASWCGPCRQVTPMLAKVYDAVRAQDAASGRAPRFEIVLVSEDEDQGSFSSYFAKMPWLALDFAQRDVKEAITERFEVQGIPRLILLDGKTGKPIVEDAVSSVLGDPEGFPWLPKPVTVLNESNGSILGDGPAVVVFAPTPAAAKDFQARFIPVVEALRADKKAEDVVVAVAPPNRLTAKVLEITKSPKSALIAVDLQEGQFAVAPGAPAFDAVSPDAFRAFVEAVGEGKVEWAKLG